MNLNTNYIVLFKNPRDMTQIEVLGCQMYGKKWKAFTNAYKMATELAHEQIGYSGCPFEQVEVCQVYFRRVVA